MIKNIIFDLGGVLVPLNRPACVGAFRDLGCYNFETILDSYVQAGFFLDYEMGLIDTEEFKEKIREHIDEPLKSAADNQRIERAMAAFLEPVPSYKLDLLINLKSRFRTFLLSNTNPIAIDAVKPFFNYRGYTLETMFEKLYLSYKMKMAKPSEEIFKTLLTQSALKPHETLFIDDAPANIEAARLIGINSLLYKIDDNLESLINNSI